MRACMDRPDRTAVLAAAQRPVLFIGGEQDRVVSLRRQRESAEAASAVLEIITGAAHQVPLEQPVALAGALSAWLDGRA
jgi:pimeloyl-ACP methyl ester carboxylesterase